MNIRPAQLSDLEELKDIEQEIIKYERQFADNLKNDPISYYDLKDLILRDDALVLVIEADKVIIATGYGLVKQSVDYKIPSRYVYLGFMYVAPRYRGTGLNGKLLDHFESWAKEQEIHEMQLDVYAENKNALRAYKKKNFQPDLLTMRMTIVGANL